MIEEKKKWHLPEVLRQMREKLGLPQRKVAAFLDIDTATYCKIENGKYLPNKMQVEHLAVIFSCNRDDLVKVWLADKIVELAESDKSVTDDAMKLANKTLKI